MGKLGVRLATFTLSPFLALPLSRVTQLVDEASFLVFGEGSGDLAHHLPRRSSLAVRSSPEAVSSRTPRLIRKNC